MEISEAMIKKACSQTIYKRGLEYYKQGRVHLKTRDKNTVTAVVDGDRVYNVSVKLNENGLSEYFCTCPYYETMDCVCKHIVAVLKQRQAELEHTDFEDGNRVLAGKLWNAFSMIGQKPEKLHLGISLTIQSMTSGSSIYNAALKLNLKPLQNPESFLECFISENPYSLHNKVVYDPMRHCFGERETKILQILSEAYQSRAAQSPYYVKSPGEIHIGSQTLKRIFMLLEGTDYDITFNRIHMGRPQILEQNPDILVDICATDDEIVLYSDNYGTAVVPDGSIFFFEDMLYRPDSQWRSWFMPIYKSLSRDNRTWLSFRGENAIGFAAYVLPKLQDRHGVTAKGIEETVVHTEPKFSAYLDRRGNSVLCTLKAAYGDISIKLPEGEASGQKIVVRDQEAETELLACVKNFEYEKGYYILEQDEDIFEFITNGIYELEKRAEIFCSDRFSQIRIHRYIPIRATISRRYDVNLLEAGFESKLTVQEMAGILSAVRLKKKYYRASGGEFYDIASNLKALTPLESIYPGEGDRAQLPFYQLLYLCAAQSDGQFQGIILNDDVKKMAEELKSVKAQIPKHLESVLRTYQKEGLDWMAQLASMGLGGILADDMGLGKTLQALAFVWGKHPKEPVFVVTPSALTYNWLREAEKFLPEARVLIIEGSAQERAALIKKAPEYDFVITSYPLLRRDSKAYEEIAFSYMFIDEAQNIKNPKTMNARAVKKIRARYHFALTGTPIENSLSELWSIFDFVMPGYLKSLRDFKEWFEGPIMKEGDQEAMEELRLKIKPFILRRMKKDVLAELPEKFEDTIYAELTPEQRKVYAAYQEIAKNEALSILAAEGGNGKMQVLTLLLRLRQICCHPALFDAGYQKDSGKMKVLEELTVSAVAAGHRLLIFSQFTSMLEIICKRFTQKGISYFYLDGSTPSQERSDMTQRFNDGENSVFLISLRAGGAGLNLTGADMVIHYDPWWNPAVMDQASDRAHRIGQTRSVQIIRLASKGTIEENILKLQEKKRSLADDIITTNHASLQSLSTEEIISLFE